MKGMVLVALAVCAMAHAQVDYDALKQSVAAGESPETIKHRIQSEGLTFEVNRELLRAMQRDDMPTWLIDYLIDWDHTVYAGYGGGWAHEEEVYSEEAEVERYYPEPYVYSAYPYSFWGPSWSLAWTHYYWDFYLDQLIWGQYWPWYASIYYPFGPYYGYSGHYYGHGGVRYRSRGRLTPDGYRRGGGEGRRAVPRASSDTPRRSARSSDGTNRAVKSRSSSRSVTRSRSGSRTSIRSRGSSSTRARSSESSRSSGSRSSASRSSGSSRGSRR